MKSSVGFSLFIVAVLLLAIFIGFQSKLVSPDLPYDDIQKGLNQKIIIKFSHVVAENTPKGLAVEYFASKVHQKTNGKVEVQVYPNATLYTDINEMQALQQGEIQMIAPAFSNISTILPSWLALDLPFAFPNQLAVDESLQGEVGQMLFDSLEEKEMKGLAFWNNGFKHVTSNQRRLLVPEDFRGQRFRIIQSEVLEDQFNSFHAEAVSIPFNEVYRSIEKGIVDGQENTISNIFSKRLYRVQKYMTISNHGYLGYAVIMNKDFWNRLSPDIQSVLLEAIQETTKWNNNLAIKMNDIQLNQLRNMAVMKIDELTDEQRYQWIVATDPLYDKYANKIGPKLVAKIKEIRTKYTFPK